MEDAQISLLSLTLSLAKPGWLLTAFLATPEGNIIPLLLLPWLLLRGQDFCRWFSKGGSAKFAPEGKQGSKR